MGLLITGLKHILENCSSCKKCQTECDFLKQHGTPKEIVDAFISGKLDGTVAFECNLCRLCNAVCPLKLNPADMVLEMRQKWYRACSKPIKKHIGIINYERMGHSKWFKWYSLPEDCNTIFFPGCALPGTRPAITIKLFELLQRQIPSLGVVLDCCLKPSHDLGRVAYFNEQFNELTSFLLENGVINVLVACPNCFKVFETYGEGLTIRSVYEYLTEIEMPQKVIINQTMTVHDSCVTRFEKKTPDSVRHLISRQGIKIREMPHSQENTLCCGEGGSASLISPDLTQKWCELRKKEAGDNMVVTYCAGCADRLGRQMPVTHILDLIFEPESATKGPMKVARSPFTYINRLRLKYSLKSMLKTKISRNRVSSSQAGDSVGSLKKYMIILVIITGMLSVHFSDLYHLFDPEILKQFIAERGVFTPLLYMMIYAVAPTFLIPGLPITIVGGILFGPFWGVVYTMLGSTAGACMPFLISRYLARKWIESKIKNGKYQKLDMAVEHNGWKAVALTRLIPVFPYNILNYAFGLTKISFFHYLLTTFICMLPGCISYVVFSSSILEVLKGHISIHFLIGVVLVVMITLIPSIYKKYKGNK
jgi:uncharacterized membrane protein YdjX (TVP38/TMEM64 family)/Fe-S oxidoreductase